MNKLLRVSGQDFRKPVKVAQSFNSFRYLPMTISRANFFIQAINILCGSLDILKTMDQFRQFIKAHIPAEHLYLGIDEPKLERFRHLIVSNEQGTEWANEILPMSRSIREIFKFHDPKQPSFVNDVMSHEAGASIKDFLPSDLDLSADETISSLRLLLMVEGKMIGFLTLNCRGASCFNQRHVDLLAPLQESLALILNNSLHHREVLRLQEILAEENELLRKEARRFSDHVIGKDFGLRQVMEAVTRVATKDVPILLLGETGTGKEVIANAAHNVSKRKDGPFIKVNCGAIPDTLMDSELFGHEKGAFTGAFERKKGRFERAHKGTIFLDEIGELPAAVQIRLLRVIQTQEIERVGGTETIPLDIRIIAATHRDLAEMSAEGRFREDLFYRLNVFPVHIPPLRERRIDLPELVDFFIERKSKDLKLREVPRLSPGTMDRLMAYDWPGNVRELENMVERALILYRSGELDLDDYIPTRQDAAPRQGAMVPEELPLFDEMARQHILKAIKKANGRLSGPQGAAALLGLNRSTLRGKMRKLGIG